MTNVRIRSIDVASHKLDDSAPPNYGTMNIEVGGVPLKLFLSQERVDAVVAAVEPIMRGVLCEVSAAMDAARKPRIVA